MPRPMPPTPSLRRCLVLVLLGLGLFLAACVSPSRRAWALAERTTWTLSRIDGHPPVEGTRAELHVEGGRRLFGFGGVNEFFGSYLRDGERFASTKLASTRRAGPDDLEAQERTLLDHIEAADRIVLHDARLSLFEGERALLEFVPAKGTRLR